MRNVVLSATLGLVGIASAMPLPAQPSLQIRIPLPPPIVFPAPPNVVVLPESRVYVVPEAREDIFFFDGLWWRPWGGRWYRSHYYDRGWAHYGSVPTWYRGVPHGWREDYRNHRWGSGAWHHEYIRHDDLQRNWRGWRDNRHWDQPQYRQHEARRDGRPYVVHEDRGRRPDVDRHVGGGRGPEVHRPEPGRPVEHENRGRGPENRPQGRPEHENRGRPGGHEEPRRERH